jgi:gluconate 5-dehydrogenase
MNPFSVTGRLAMVTGGSRGIGLGAAQALGKSGARVILVARNEEPLRTGARELRAEGIETECSVMDLGQPERIAQWFTECTGRLGTPDILVNAAAITRRGMATELRLEDWTATMTLNATSVFELSRCFARTLIAEGRMGKVINLASLMTAAARRGTSAYTASKGAIGQLTKALAVDWAPHGILVNAVAPGYIETDLNEALLADPQFDAWVKQRCPLGRWGKPEDIAWPIVFLASSASDYITGQVLYVDGGWLATF